MDAPLQEEVVCDLAPFVTERLEGGSGGFNGGQPQSLVVCALYKSNEKWTTAWLLAPQPNACWAENLQSKAAWPGLRQLIAADADGNSSLPGFPQQIPQEGEADQQEPVSGGSMLFFLAW